MIHKTKLFLLLTFFIFSCNCEKSSNIQDEIILIEECIYSLNNSLEVHYVELKSNHNNTRPENQIYEKIEVILNKNSNMRKQIESLLTHSNLDKESIDELKGKMNSFAIETTEILEGQYKEELDKYIKSLKLVEAIKYNQKGEELKYMLLKLRLKSQLISIMAITYLYT